MTIRLLAMSESGDVFIMRDPTGQTWLHQAFDGEEPVKVDDDGVARAISFGDLVLVEQDFASYQDLEEFLEGQGGQYASSYGDPGFMSVDEATLLVDVATRWIKAGTVEESAEAKELLLIILANPVSQDDALRAAIAAALRLVDPGAAAEAEGSSAARERYRAVTAPGI